MTYLVDELRRQGVSEEALRVRAWRRQHKVTQRDLAREAGVTVDMLHRYESGGRQSARATETVRLHIGPAMQRLAQRVDRRRAWERAS